MIFYTFRLFISVKENSPQNIIFVFIQNLVQARGIMLAYIVNKIKRGFSTLTASMQNRVYNLCVFVSCMDAPKVENAR